MEKGIGLPAPTGVDLRLHHAEAAAEPARRIGRLRRCSGELPGRHRHAELAQEPLRLILVDVHSLELDLRDQGAHVLDAGVEELALLGVHLDLDHALDAARA